MKHLLLFMNFLFFASCSLLNEQSAFEKLEAKYPDLLTNRKPSTLALVKREVSSINDSNENRVEKATKDEKRFQETYLDSLKNYGEKSLQVRIEWQNLNKQYFHTLKEDTKENVINDLLKNNGQYPKSLVSAILDNTFEKDFNFLTSKEYLDLVKIMLDRKKVADLDTAIRILSEFEGKEVVVTLLKMSDFYRDPSNVGSADKQYYSLFRTKFEKLTFEDKTAFLKEARSQNIIKNNSAQVLLTSIMENEKRLLENLDAKALARGLTIYNFGNATLVGRQFLEVAEGDECNDRACLDSGEVSLRL